MSCILHIETSTEACSVAVSEDGWNEFKVSDLNGPQHAVQLGVFVDEALSFVDSHGMVLDAVAVSCGPGSYTGLRIGVSMAKGICYGRNLPLIAIPTLEVMCVPVLLQQELPEDALLCPMIDARRMEVYAALYDRALNVKREIAADIVDENSYLEFLEKHPVYFFGNGSAKCREHAHTVSAMIQIRTFQRGVLHVLNRYVVQFQNTLIEQTNDRAICRCPDISDRNVTYIGRKSLYAIFLFHLSVQIG